MARLRGRISQVRRQCASVHNPPPYFPNGVRSAHRNEHHSERPRPDWQAAPKKKDIGVRHKPKYDSQHHLQPNRLLATRPSRQPSHSPPKKRMVREIEHPEDKRVDAILGPQPLDMVPEMVRIFNQKESPAAAIRGPLGRTRQNMPSSHRELPHDRFHPREAISARLSSRQRIPSEAPA